MSKQSWTEVRVEAPEGWHELVGAALSLGPCTTVVVGATSIATEPPREGFEFVRTFFPTREDTPALRSELEAALARLAETTGAEELRDLRVTWRPLPAEDYATSWRRVQRPFRLGRIALVPSWESPSLREDDLLLSIEPGKSFGSGRHATTRTCMRVLQERSIQGARVLDAGTGSGILSVTAAMLGAASTLGFDIDPVSEEAGAELAERNGVGERCRFRTGDFGVLDPEDEGFDVVLANIYSDVIQAHAADLRARLRPGGWYAFSGCPVHHREATRAAIEAAGLELEEERIRGRWSTFVGTRPS